MASKNLIQILITAKNLASKDIKKTDKDLEGLGKTLRKVSAIATAAGVAVGLSMFKMAQSTAKVGDEFAKFERATGAQANTLAALRFAIKRWGGTNRDADTALRRLTKAIADGSSGLESYVRIWNRLGLTQEDLITSGGAMVGIDEILPVIADKFRQLEDATLKADAAQILFGRGGLRIVPLLNQGSEGLELMAERAERLGILFAGKTLKDAEQFQDTMLDMREAIQGNVFAIGSQLIPVIIRLSDVIVNNLIGAREWVEQNKELTVTIAGTAAALTAGGGLIAAITATTFAWKLLKIQFAGAAGPIGIVIALVSVLIGRLIAMKIIAKDALTPRGDIEQQYQDITRAIRLSGIQLERLKRLSKKPLERISTDDIIAAEEKHRKKVAELTEELEALGRQLQEMQAAERAAEDQNRTNALLTELRTQRVNELRAALENLPSKFEFELATGQADISDAIARQKDEIQKLEKALFAASAQTEFLGSNLDQNEIVIQNVTDKSNALWAAKLKLLQLVRELAEAIRDENAAMSENRAEIFANRMRDLRDEHNASVQSMGDRWKKLQEKNRAEFEVTQRAVQSGLGRIMISTNKFRDSFKAVFVSLANEAIAQLSRVIAKMLLVFVLKRVLSPGSVGAIPHVNQAADFVETAKGGTIVKGVRGRDTVPILAQRGENVLDRSSNERFNELMDMLESGGGTGGGGNVIIQAGVYTGTRQEDQRFQDFIRRSGSDFERTMIAEGAL